MANTIDLAQYKYTLTLDSSNYDKGMVVAKQNAENMKTKLDGVGSFLKGAFVTGLAAAGAAIAGTIAEGVKSYADLEEQMASFKSATGASTDEVAKVQEIAQKLYETNTDSMEDIVSTAAEMETKMGATADQIEALQQTIMDFAKTTNMSNTDVVDAVDHIGDAWGLTAEESVGYLDVLKKSSEEYGTDVSSVTSALSEMAPAAKALGLSLDETNGIMNLFASSGLDSSQAITGLTYAAKQVKSPEEFKTMLADIQAIADPTERAQRAVELFGARAGVALSNAFDGNKSLKDFILTTKECTGTVSDASAAFDSNFNVQLELAKKQFSGLAMEIGEKVMPVVNNILSWVTANMPQIVSTVEGAINYISALFTPFITLIKSLISNFQDANSQTNISFTAIGDVISAVVLGIQTIIQGFVNLISAIWSKWGADISANATQTWNNISAVIGSVLNIIKGVLDTFTAMVNGDWKGFLDGLLSIASGVWDLIKNLFKTATDAIGTLLETVLNGIITLVTGFATKLYDAGVSLFTSLWDGIKSVWESISSWVSDKVSWIADKLTFWNNASATMSSDPTGTVTTRVDGSHANGLSFVPFDGYTAVLHYGERVLTAEQNAAYNTQNTTNSNQTLNLKIGDIQLSGVQDTNSFANAIVKKLPGAITQKIFKK